MLFRRIPRAVSQAGLGHGESPLTSRSGIKLTGVRRTHPAPLGAEALRSAASVKRSALLRACAVCPAKNPTDRSSFPHFSGILCEKPL